MEDIKDILSYRNTMRTFNLNKKVMQDKTSSALIHHENGGSFDITQELIGFLNYAVQQNKTTIVILDRNNLPIKINDIPKLLETISDRYFEVVNDFYIQYEQLRSSSKIEIALEI
jgi:hypothetical protein